MNLIQRSWLVFLMTLFVGAGTCFAQSRIELVQGKRAIADKISFVFEVTPDPRYPNPPDGIQIFTRFQDHAATGKVYVDGKVVGRFDEAMAFNSNPIDAKFGRHTITISFASPAVVIDFMVAVRGPGVAREILDEQEAIAMPPDLAKRVTDLEKKVQDLEAEIASLKKKRNH
jgi:hypothetical protein